MICDLHTHSIFSDGSFTPAEIIDTAIKTGLSAIALTDHNTVDGLPDFIAASHGKNIDIAPGVEFSVDYDGIELHMLGLFIKPEAIPSVTEYLQIVIKRKEQSYINLVDALNRAGFDLNYDKIKGATPTGVMNRAHIATAMVKSGRVSSLDEAYASYLSKTEFYKKPNMFTVWEVLDFIKSIGAVSVLAHPFGHPLKKLTFEQVSEFLPRAKEAGLVGMECYYSTYDEETIKTALYLADKFDVLPSGGSDFHGALKTDIKLGIGKGNLNIPYEWYSKLKEKAR